MMDEDKEKYQRLYYKMLRVRSAIGKAKSPMNSLENSLSSAIVIDGQSLYQSNVNHQASNLDDVYNTVDDNDLPYIRRKMN
ncbi:MAG: hypothetical protein IJG97_02410 [Bacilli bacterium]|nr:hypothetical protein [Bacilli bacterium]